MSGTAADVVLSAIYSENSEGGDKNWEHLKNFVREVNGEIVMRGGKNIQHVQPGSYVGRDIADFGDLPKVKPKYVAVSGVVWFKSPNLKKNGILTFPSFPGDTFPIPVQHATSELLSYYDCTFANVCPDEMRLKAPHAIQDFTYSKNYLEKYVLTPKNQKGPKGHGGAGGAGLERHEFHHLDCPLDKDSGVFVLAKFVDEEETELHISGFHIPVRHTLYIPNGVIHTNNYLKGTWRTMLSDGDIDFANFKKGEMTLSPFHLHVGPQDHGVEGFSNLVISGSGK